jgi:hypothetical protein
MTVARDLVMKGWQPVWCLQRQSGGFSPMEGLTGYEAPYPTVVPQPPGAHRLGFRPPPEVVIIDVDHYDAKRGADTIDRAEEWLGDLPLTYKVTSRGVDDPSGRYLFRKPADLDFSDRALAQFADEHGKTSVEILRTGHRFSWAPGDINHKNGKTVQCFDPDGEPCLLPDVTEIPELPQRWVEYLRNPPSAPSLGSYVRPGDGPQWWLMQPDESLSSDSELAQFAFDMMLSRVPMDDIFTHWLRVSRSDDPSWPWSREDFDRHVRSQAQAKAATAIAREDAELSVYEGLAGSPEKLQGISREANESFEREQKLAALRDQRIAEAVAQVNPFPVVPLEVDEPQPVTQSDTEFVSALVRGTPEYDRQFKYTLARKQAEIDVAELLATPFTGFRKIGTLPEPPEPETLRIVGKDSKYSSVIARAKVTVISGHRSSGKTWVTAAWAAQEMIAGNAVFWIDFERQDDQLTSKLRMLGVNQAMIDGQLRYTAVLPPAPLLTRAVEEASEHGTHRVLVVVDAFRALQGRIMPGTNANDGDAVEQVYTEYLTPVSEAGANLALLDHMSKTGDAGTFGSERKESAADYVIKVEKMCPFSKRTSGYSMLTLTKARGGHFDEGTPVGYLWVPADGDGQDRGISNYPRYPELRNWAPEVAMSLEDTGDTSEMGQKEMAVLDLVRENRLALGTRELGRDLHSAYPDLFKSDQAANAFARRMVAKGKLTKEEGKLGKYDLPDRPEPGSSPTPALDPALLEYEA